MKNSIIIVLMGCFFVLTLEAQVKEIPLTVTNELGKPLYAKFSPDSKKILFFGKGLKPACYAMEIIGEHKKIPYFNDFDLYYTETADFHPSGDYFVFAAVIAQNRPPFNNPIAYDKTCVWSLANNTCAGSLISKEANENSILEAKFNKTGSHLLLRKVVGNRLEAFLWDWVKGEEPQISLSNHHTYFSYDGDYVFQTWVNSIIVTDIKGLGKKEIKVKLTEGDLITTASATCDNDKVMLGTDRGNIEVWDVESEEVVRKKEVHTKSIEKILFDKNCKRFLIISEDALVKVFNYETMELQATLKGHSAIVTDAQFSPDGNFVVTGSNDSTACIWDSRTGDRLAILANYKGAVNTTQFSVTGDTVLVSDDYGEAHMYTISGLHPSAIETEGTNGNDMDINVVCENNVLRIEFTKEVSKTSTYTVINYMGEVIMKGSTVVGNKQFELPMQNINSGMYILVVECNGKIKPYNLLTVN